MPQQLSMIVVRTSHPNSDGSNCQFEIYTLNRGDPIRLELEPSNKIDCRLSLSIRAAIFRSAIRMPTVVAGLAARSSRGWMYALSSSRQPGRARSSA